MMCDAIHMYFPGLAIPRVKPGNGPQHVAPMAEKRKGRSRDHSSFCLLKGLCGLCETIPGAFKDPGALQDIGSRLGVGYGERKSPQSYWTIPKTRLFV